MIDFRMNEEQEMLTEAIGRFARDRVRKAFRDAEEEGYVPVDLVAAGWEMGLLPTALPESVGGFGEYSLVTSVLALEEFAWGDLATTLHICTPHLVAIPLLLLGTEEQKESYLPHFADVEIPRVTAAFIEPSIQFDPRSLRTTARLEGDVYVLDGQKSMVPLAADAELFLVYAMEGEALQAFLVPADADGLVVGARERLMGVQAYPTFGLTLEACRVPAANRLGGEAGINMERLLAHSRLAQGALAVGMARAAYEYAREYAKERVQFGEPVAHRQSIAFMLAEMAIDVDAARLMVWEAAWLADEGKAFAHEAAVMKHYIDDMVLRVCDEALQVLGGYGYIREYPVELWLRNARGFAMFDGFVMV